MQKLATTKSMYCICVCARAMSTSLYNCCTQHKIEQFW